MPVAVDQRTYTIRRKILTLFGAKFHVFDPAGELVFFSKQKAFKLKEDIRIYGDEEMTREKLVIQARNVIDFSAAYDVLDAEDGEKIGALRRRGFKSILRDSWEILDNHDDEIGRIQEDSVAKAMVRRFLSNLVPQTFHAIIGDQQVVTYRQHFNPFVQKVTVTLLPEAEGRIDPRLALAAGMLLVAIEGRQGS